MGQKKVSHFEMHVRVIAILGVGKGVLFRGVLKYLYREVPPYTHHTTVECQQQATVHTEEPLQ